MEAPPVVAFAESLESARPSRSPPGRFFSIVQVILCTGVPSQILIGMVMVLVALVTGIQLFLPNTTTPTANFIAVVALGDTVIVVGLICAFVVAGGERLRDVFVGPRLIGRELGVGVLLLPVVFALVIGGVTFVQRVAPSLHNVTENPFDVFFDTPFHRAVFAFVAVFAGGVREEMQRGFILHRFGQGLGGVWVGLVLTSLAFGAGHVDQGYDVAATMVLVGLLWGVVYIRRRSVIAGMTSHAGFDLAQVVWQVVVRAAST